MDKISKLKKIKKINPNEYGSLLYNFEELYEIQKILLNKKIFRYASRKKSVTDEFEDSIKKYLNVKYALGVNNGTSALKAALFAAGVKRDDRVLISSFTFIATAAAVVSLGAIPIPIDFDPNYCLDLKDLKTEIKKGCKAIIVVHLQGRTFDLSSILTIAKSKKIIVIEDACQAFASKFRGKYAGTFADIGVYSFQQYKQISAGEGGMVVTNNKMFYNIAKNYTDHGIVRDLMTWDNDASMIGDNYRMNNLQAAILKIQIKKIKEIIHSQKFNRAYILKKIDQDKISNLVNSLDVSGETGMNIFFLLDSKKVADLAIAHARTKNIEVRKLWDRPYYLHGVFKKAKLDPLSLGKNICSTAEDMTGRLVSISVPPTLTVRLLDRIILEIIQLKKLNYIH